MTTDYLITIGALIGLFSIPAMLAGASVRHSAGRFLSALNRQTAKLPTSAFLRRVVLLWLLATAISLSDRPALAQSPNQASNNINAVVAEILVREYL